MWKIYILQCSDESYYVGYTVDLVKRIKDHNAGKGSNYTKLRRPVELKYFEEKNSRVEAEKREKDIKKLSKLNKIKLIKRGKGVKVSLGLESSKGSLGTALIGS